MTTRETVTRDALPPPPPGPLDAVVMALRIWPFTALTHVGAGLLGQGYRVLGGATCAVGIVGMLVISRRVDALARRIHRG